MKRRIRYHTWYWGKWVYEGDVLDGSIVTLALEGFEEYVEAVHGWHHSEEAKSWTEIEELLRLIDLPGPRPKTLTVWESL